MTKRRALSVSQKAAVIKRQDGKCAKCRAPFGDVLAIEFDHRISLAMGGADHIDNIDALCRPCHRAKTYTPINGDISKIAKTKRIQAQDGLMRKKPSAQDKALARMLERT